MDANNLVTSAMQISKSMCYLVLGFIYFFSLLSLVQAQSLPAGSVVSARAWATFIPDGGSTIQEVVSSNTVFATVAPVEALSLSGDTQISRPAGAPVVIPHTLINTGNVKSSYTLHLETESGSTFTVQNLHIIRDIEGNGQISENDPELPQDKSGVLSLASGGVAHLLLVGSIPNIESGTSRLRITASSTGNPPVSASNLNVITASEAATLVLQASVDQASPVLSGQRLIYQIRASNLGNQSAQPIDKVKNQPILIDGIPRKVLLLNAIVPDGTDYQSGALSSSLSRAILLSRFKNDPPYSYHRGDLPGAQEVAVALEDTLSPGEVLTFSFAAKINGQTSSITNSAYGHFNSGLLGMQTTQSNVLQLYTLRGSLGVAKAASTVKFAADGTASVRYTFVLQNYGTSTLYDLSLEDLLDGDARFGQYTNAATPVAGTYTIEAGSLAVLDTTLGASLKINPDYQGTGNVSDVLSGGVIPPLGVARVAFTVRFNISGRPEFISNTATGRAAQHSGGTPSVFAPSYNGNDPCPDGSNDPSKFKSPTVISSKPQKLIIEKSVSALQPVAGTSNQFDLEFTLMVKNIGTVSAPFVRVSDNLACAFNFDKTNNPVESFSLRGPPVMEKGVLVSAGAKYSGNTYCNRSAQDDPNPMVGAGAATVATTLNNGSRTMAPGAIEVIHLPVRIILNSGKNSLVLKNTAFTATYLVNQIDASPQAAAKGEASIVLVDGVNTVYDSQTRIRIPNATVTVTRVSCTSGAAGPIKSDEILPAINQSAYKFNGDGSLSITTDAQGVYEFAINPEKVSVDCKYDLKVTPPSGSPYEVSSSIPPKTGTAPPGPVQVQEGPPSSAESTQYYLSTQLGQTNPAIVHDHIPLDSKPASGLFLKMSANRSIVSIGDFMEYKLTAKNISGYGMTGITFSDVLPYGFSYVSGSARLNGEQAADPISSAGSSLNFNYPQQVLFDNREVDLTYRVRVGINTAIGQKALNRAQVASGPARSLEAQLGVQVEGGVFSDEGFIFGKVNLACPSQLDIGVPGVRLVLEDGTSVVTDSEGKYSLYGLRPITHVLKVDGLTLPAGAKLQAKDVRHAGRGETQFVDLKKGELHKTNFVIENCTPQIEAAVKERRKSLSVNSNAEGEAVLNGRFDVHPSAPSLGDLKALPASGVVGTPVATKGNASVANNQEQTISSRPVATLEEEVKVVPDNSLGFISLKDRQVLPLAVATIRVKGPLGAILKLSAGGREIPESRVGKKLQDSEHQLQAREYVGVDLKPGKNLLHLMALDSFGNVRGEQSITVIAPGNFAKISIIVPDDAKADGQTQAKIIVRLTDKDGIPVTSKMPVTLETNLGRWDVTDANPNEPGVQTVIEGGIGQFGLTPPDTAGEARIQISVGTVKEGAQVVFLPAQRPMLAVGIIEGTLNLSKLGKVDLGKSGAGNPFEQELREFASSNNGKVKSTGRAAFYLKGTIKGKYLLTAAYDTDKQEKTTLFRDIQPDKFYPVYGDASIKSFDAQSTGKLYVRIEKNRSWLLLGDFITNDGSEVRQLSQFNRVTTGAKQHYENKDLSVTSFASQGTRKHTYQEISANGTSGPYQLDGAGDFFANSETIEIITRDRNQPSIIIRRRSLQRFVDYQVNTLTKTILFNMPIPTLDVDLNRNYIAVNYETDSGGVSFWMGGVEAEYKVTDSFQVGANWTRDNNPDNPTTLLGANFMAKMGTKTSLIGEVAQSDTAKNGKGNAERIEFRHESDNMKIRATAVHSDKDFDNPGATGTRGHTDVNFLAEQKLNDKNALRAEGIISLDAISGAQTRGALFSYVHNFEHEIQVEIGMRGAKNSVNIAAASGVPDGRGDENLFTLRGKSMAPVPFVKGARVYIEGEQDLRDKDKKMLALGGDYQINPKSRAYGRYEIISSLGSQFALNSTGVHNTAVFGVESGYMEGGSLYNEYRLRDTLSGREGESAVGLRNLWNVTSNWRLSTRVEHTGDFLTPEGAIKRENALVLAGGFEYFGIERMKLSGSVERRTADAVGAWLHTVGMAYKLSDSWSLLSRYVISQEQVKNVNPSATVRFRGQIGAAYRPVDSDVWNALMRYEKIVENVAGGAMPGRNDADILSAHINYQPGENTVLAGRYATKVSGINSAGIYSMYVAHLVQLRLTQDIGTHFDISPQLGFLVDNQGGRRAIFGLEGGAQIADNLWLSLGYNFLGARDEQLADTGSIDQGAYLRLRMKFDETLFGSRVTK